MSQAAEHYFLPDDVFSNKKSYLTLVRQGIAGEVVKQLVQSSPAQRNVVIKALGTSSNNLSRFYNKKHLNTQQSEEILDIIQVERLATTVFGDQSMAKEWLACPIPALDNAIPNELLDTFIGREMIKDALLKIEYGEFS